MAKSVMFQNPSSGNVVAWLVRFILEYKRWLWLAGVGLWAVLIILTRIEDRPVLALSAMGTRAPTERRAEKTAFPDAQMCEFALAEARKAIVVEPSNKVLTLTVDPDYFGAGKTILVNAVLDADGRRESLGVLVTVDKTALGLRARLAYID